MPIYLNILFPNDIELNIWHVTESVSFFSEHQEWYEQEQTWIESIHEKRRLEYLASRYLIYTRLRPNRKLPIIKDEFGKLRFEESDRFLSISHSGLYSAFVFGPKEVGVDIQIYENKILRILEKFLSKTELEWIHQFTDSEQKIKNSTLLWTAKEAIYKAHGKRGIQFNKQILLSFEGHKLKSGELSLQDQSIDYAFNYELEEDFVWLVAHHIEQPDYFIDDFL
ncbi:MAG: 4'-phosphopantetheinyl transferase superfamily protein [Saprospiraceae bacterium]